MLFRPSLRLCHILFCGRCLRGCPRCFRAAEMRCGRSARPVPPTTRRPAMPEKRRSASSGSGKEDTAARILKKGTYHCFLSVGGGISYIKPAPAAKTAVDAPFSVAFAVSCPAIRAAFPWPAAVLLRIVPAQSGSAKTTDSTAVPSAPPRSAIRGHSATDLPRERKLPMSSKWKAKLQKALAAFKGWRPVFELHYEEESGLYPRGDADEGAVLRRSEGLLRTDLRKIAAILSVFGLLLYLHLRHH